MLIEVFSVGGTLRRLVYHQCEVIPSVVTSLRQQRVCHLHNVTTFNYFVYVISKIINTCIRNRFLPLSTAQRIVTCVRAVSAIQCHLQTNIRFRRSVVTVCDMSFDCYNTLTKVKPFF